MENPIHYSRFSAEECWLRRQSIRDRNLSAGQAHRPKSIVRTARCLSSRSPRLLRREKRQEISEEPTLASKTEAAALAKEKLTREAPSAGTCPIKAEPSGARLRTKSSATPGKTRAKPVLPLPLVAHTQIDDFEANVSPFLACRPVGIGQRMCQSCALSFSTKDWRFNSIPAQNEFDARSKRRLSYPRARTVMATRRSFLTQVGRAGGFGATYLVMQSLGLLPVPPSEANVPRLASPAGGSRTVVILGAGIAGLVSAWELSKAGYRCVVLEARGRAGGRNWTIRHGTRVEMTDGTVQTCSFDESNYFNAGPARLPSQHRTMLGYCREFGVPLEVEVNTSRSALLQSDRLNGGRPVEQRQLVNDTRGHVAELLAKAICRDALDQELSSEDKERMLAFLRIYGDLSPDYFYKGSERAGFRLAPGAGERDGVVRNPIDMHVLLDARLWEGLLYEEQFAWQATMFQPIGGMDQIPAAFEKRVGHLIRFHCQIEQIRQTSTGVSVRYNNRKTGALETADADYCICALPFTVLKKIDADFSPEVKQIIDSVAYDAAYKIAWESPRFWEKEYSIYGGISFLDRPVNLVWYPSARLFSEKGVIIAGYNIENGSILESMDLAAKLDASRQSVEALHPGHSRDLKTPICVCWGRIPHSLGSWIHISGDSAMYPGYERIIQPDGPIFFSGDHTSHLVGWQEGAALSAHRAVSLIGQAQHTDRQARNA